MSFEMRQVWLRGRGRARLDAIDVVFEPGTIYGLVGPNGAGKTSLMSVLAGLTPATRGQVVPPPDERFAGVFLSADSMHPGRTVGETLRLRASYIRQGDEVVRLALRRSGLKNVSRRRVGALSLGMRVRLGIAVALLGDPALVLLDEPMNGLDPNGIAWVRDVVRGLRDRGAVVLLSSHLLGELEQLIDVAVVMSAGRITRIERMNGGEALGSVIETDDHQRFLSALLEAGRVGEGRGAAVVSDLAAPDAVRLAVAHGLDVRRVHAMSADLEHLYTLASTGEHVAGVAR